MFRPMRWFGESWGAPLCDTCEHTETPAGEPCLWCEEPIATEESGILAWSIGVASVGYRPLHCECWTRSTVGSVGHLFQRCRCYGGAEEDPAGMTRREAAKAATSVFLAQIRQSANERVN